MPKSKRRKAGKAEGEMSELVIVEYVLEWMKKEEFRELMQMVG